MCPRNELHCGAKTYHIMAKPTLAIYGIFDGAEKGRQLETHDHNICLMSEGRVVRFLQLERFTQVKHDNRLHQFLDEILTQAGWELPDEFDFVSVNSFAGNSFVTNTGDWRFESAPFPKDVHRLHKGILRSQRSSGERLTKDAWLCPHELAHIASVLPFHGALEEETLAVHFDGGASVSNFSAAQILNGELQTLRADWKTVELAKLFNANRLMFQLLNAETWEHVGLPGKLMGYAAMGKADTKILQWLQANNFFFGAQNQTNDILHSVMRAFGLDLESVDYRHPFWMDVAATVQAHFTDSVLVELELLQKRTRAKTLVYTGGCALNITTNSAILSSGIFDTIQIPPCCNDTGLSLGAAAFLEWKKHGRVFLHTPYLNSLMSEEPQKLVCDEEIHRMARDITQGEVVGIFQGAGEVGPRALGNRSIIARADDRQLAKKVSVDLKRREWYRPIAPVMLGSLFEEFFGYSPPDLTKYMLLDVQLPEALKQYFAGVVHTNGTVRVQCINSENENPFLFQLLRCLWAEYGLLALINTSFNIAGKPIVHEAEHALDAASQMGLDGLLLNNKYFKTDELEGNRGRA